MKNILTYSMFNESNYDNTSWTKTINGKEVTIPIREVEKYLDSKNVEPEKIFVSEIKHMCAHKDKTDKKTLKRSQNSNLDYPIIISKLDGYLK